ncbi:hypothetical protein [Gimibacter soli]|uniref:Solute-binding protein family 3/N-terminal domain-containing protein n=1 Tax=Gimibacter soli TaxID=3024400 RepID=A0AAF0BMG5_9PROT|nr:hypothetical protein [Gimibacter soli]WCL54481.1 hypothetical protein PH603_01755 [Gimibacter soli]
MKSCFKSVLAGLLLACSFVASADEAIIMSGQQMHGLLGDDENLPYNRLLARLTEGFDRPVKPAVLPGYRGVRDWQDGRTQCYFGTISVEDHQMVPGFNMPAEKWAKILFSRPFNLMKVHVMSVPGSVPVTNAEELLGRSVAVDQILFFDLANHSSMPKVARLVKSPTFVESLNLLLAGRVEHTIVYDNDAAIYLDANSTARFAYDPSFALLAFEESVTCWPGDGMEAFIAHIDRRITELEASGELDLYTPRLDRD